MDAIRAFLLNGIPTPQLSIENSIILTNTLVDTKIPQSNKDQSTRRPIIQDESCILRHLVERVKKQPGSLTAVIFIDGDNVISCIKSIHQLVPKEVETKQELWCIHVLIFISNGDSLSSLIGYDHSSWVSITFSKTNTKDAVDHAITYNIAALHYMLHYEANDKDVQFFIATNDGFARETKKHPTERKCHVVDAKKQNLGHCVAMCLTMTPTTSTNKKIEAKINGCDNADTSEEQKDTFEDTVQKLEVKLSNINVSDK